MRSTPARSVDRGAARRPSLGFSIIALALLCACDGGSTLEARALAPDADMPPPRGGIEFGTPTPLNQLRVVDRDALFVDLTLRYPGTTETVTATRQGSSEIWSAALTVPSDTPFSLTVSWYDIADRERLDLVTTTRDFPAFDGPGRSSVTIDFDDFDSEAFDADADSITNLQERLDETNPFDPQSPGGGTGTPPVNVDEREFRWSRTFDGALLARQPFVADDAAVLVRSTEEQRTVLRALDPDDGRVLWRLEDTELFCAPVLTGDGRAVAQADGNTAFGGEDGSSELVLIRLEDGTILDTWQPAEGRLARCGDALQLDDAGTLVYHVRSERRGFTLTDDVITPLWTHTFAADDPLAGGRGPATYDQALVVGDDLLVPTLERDAAGASIGTLYRIDGASGTTTERLVLPLSNLVGTSLQRAGPDHAAVLGTDAEGDRLVMIDGAVGGLLGIAWTRDFAGPPDGVTRAPSVLATSPGAFASWSAFDTTERDGVRGVVEFDLASGVANWTAPTSSFSNNDTIAALDGGGYVVSPFGGDLLEAFAADGTPAWSITSVEGVAFPQWVGAVGADQVVVTAPRSEDGWVIFGVDTRR